jgi:hypothetical protein
MACASTDELMSLANESVDDDLRPEYDPAQLKGGVRGKNFAKYQQGTNVVLLAPDVEAVFPTDDAVNAALRSLLRIQDAN